MIWILFGILAAGGAYLLSESSADPWDTARDAALASIAAGDYPGALDPVKRMLAYSLEHDCPPAVGLESGCQPNDALGHDDPTLDRHYLSAILTAPAAGVEIPLADDLRKAGYFFEAQNILAQIINQLEH